MPALDRNLLHRFGLLFVILLVGLALSFTTDTFLSVANLTNVARQVSINGILAV
ncbi:MAG: ribose ABC transporter permease, partial [Verrucomicrobia bacterium]|nr:ribose ABC transporter permease [Verrucomicrobiota bacterium]